MTFSPTEIRANSGARVLVVEDDPMGLTFFCSSLEACGYIAVPCHNAIDAQRLIENEGSGGLDAVLTDYRMPGKSGLELLEWISSKDQALSIIIVTAQGEKELVKESLSRGACDFLDKPVTHQQLSEVIHKAVRQTHRLRHYEHTQQSLAAAGRMDHIFSDIRAEELHAGLKLVHIPLHEVGGDFINVFKTGPMQFAAVIGDVSGHDVKAAFVSSYFQGMLRGLAEVEIEPCDGLAVFNRVLASEWSTKQGHTSWQLPPSLSVALIDFDFSTSNIRAVACGFPPIMLCDNDGFLIQGEYGSHPLGWVSDLQFNGTVYSFKQSAFLYVFTDGLIDFAAELEINTFSLLFIVFREDISLKDASLKPVDDILIFRYQFNPEVPPNTLFQPIIHEQYTGADIDQLDRIEAVWRRSLQFALQDELGDRLFDLLICLREGVINAMVHGCERSPDKVCSLQMTYNAEQQLIRVRIDDPGRGHSFDLKKRVSQLIRPDGSHMGLGIIQHLSDSFAIENKGSSLIFDFFIKGKPL